MENNDKTVSHFLDKIIEKIERKTAKLLIEHAAFNKKANKQAAKRARVLTNDITAQLKLFRKESVKAIKKIKK